MPFVETSVGFLKMRILMPGGRGGVALGRWGEGLRWDVMCCRERVGWCTYSGFGGGDGLYIIRVFRCLRSPIHSAENHPMRSLCDATVPVRRLSRN